MRTKSQRERPSNCRCFRNQHQMRVLLMEHPQWNGIHWRALPGMALLEVRHSRAAGQPGALADGREAAMKKESCSKSLFEKV